MNERWLGNFGLEEALRWGREASADWDLGLPFALLISFKSAQASYWRMRDEWDQNPEEMWAWPAQAEGGVLIDPQGLFGAKRWGLIRERYQSGRALLAQASSLDLLAMAGALGHEKSRHESRMAFEALTGKPWGRLPKERYFKGAMKGREDEAEDAFIGRVLGDWREEEKKNALGCFGEEAAGKLLEAGVIGEQGILSAKRLRANSKKEELEAGGCGTWSVHNYPGLNALGLGFALGPMSQKELGALARKCAAALSKEGLCAKAISGGMDDWAGTMETDGLSQSPISKAFGALRSEIESAQIALGLARVKNKNGKEEGESGKGKRV